MPSPGVESLEARLTELPEGGDGGGGSKSGSRGAKGGREALRLVPPRAQTSRTEFGPASGGGGRRADGCLQSGLPVTSATLRPPRGCRW